MKVLLINEPFVEDFCRTQRWAARTRGRVLRAPDWLAYATAVLERAGGIDARLYDFPARRWGRDEFKELINKERPDVLVLDSTTPSVSSDLSLAADAREICSPFIIMVGPHASALPEATLIDSNGAVDAIAVGEYDETILDIVENINNLRSVKGIVFQGESGPVRTDPRPLIEPLDRLPFPAWHHLNLLDYFDGTKLHPYIDIFSGRGCPYRCTFCLWPQVMHGRKVRLRSPEAVVDEMERDISLCPEVISGGEFFFEDDTFTAVKSNAIAICEEILKRGLKVRFSVNARSDSYDVEMFKIMKRAGARMLLVGFESGVQEILDNVKKSAKVEDAYRFMEAAKQAKLAVHGCFVLGLPGETEETIDRTIDFALSLGLDTVQFSAAVPFPGTEYYAWCESKGLLRARSWDDWLEEGEQAGVVEYPGLGRERVNRAVDRALKKFYFRPSYMVKFVLNTQSRADLYRKLRGARNFISYLLGRG